MRQIAITNLSKIISSIFIFAISISIYANVEQDRAAILAMQGSHKVSFNFHETVAFSKDYAYQKPHQSGGNELIMVLENTPIKIVLQHLLLDVKSGKITKHWRQDWQYEATKRLEFSSDQTWRWRKIAPNLTAKSWTQCVYGVIEEPRYCGTGKFEHQNGISIWTSDNTLRPLPRREYSTRNDYNLLQAINRHTITPNGFSHEQDNIKTVRDANGKISQIIVREFGFNDYRQTDQIDFAPVHNYWQQTSAYWQQVRNLWQAKLDNAAGVMLTSKVDDMSLYMEFFQQAQEFSKSKKISEQEINALIAKWSKFLK